MTTLSDGQTPMRQTPDRQYHIDFAVGEVAPFIMLVGDPARAQRVAELFDRVTHERRNREYVGYTGEHRGLALTVLATGMGPDNMEIAVVELCRCTERPTMIRCGSSGALQPSIRLGDLIIARAAYRLENTTLQYVGEGYPAAADAEVTLALIQAAEGVDAPLHVGVTATAPGFYGPQARASPGFPPRHPDLIDELSRQGVLNLEMEVSSLLTLASLRGFRAGAVCAVFANRIHHTFIAAADRPVAEQHCVELGLAAFHLLAQRDQERGDRPHWHPGLAGG